MLAYNYRKHANKSDPVREILAKLDAKQIKTGLSLYNQGQHYNPCASITSLNKTGGSLNLQEDICKQEFFPNLKAAREKAQNRITAGDLTHQEDYYQKGLNRTKKIPHRLPVTKMDSSTSQTLPPLSHGIDRLDIKINQPHYSIPDSQFDRDKINININPFGYNRKTLAFDERNVNYMVEWPESWPFKIMSFQGKSKQAKRKPKRIHRPKDPVFPSPSFPHDDSSALPWKEPTIPRARILAPVDHPTKQPVFPTRPFVESAVKRGSKKLHSKQQLRQVILRSQERDFNFNSQKSDLSRREEIDCTDGDQQMGPDVHDDGQEGDMQRIQNCERVDSVPPSTPEPDDEPERHANIKPDDDVQKEAKQVLNDIVNQIVKDDTPQI